VIKELAYQAHLRSLPIVGRGLCLWALSVAALAFPAAAKAQSSEITGMWTATVGDQAAMRGTWLALLSRANPNFARGSWRLSSDSGQTLLEGTWSAKKSGRNWEGSWTARAANGRSLSGTWSAGLVDFVGSTLHAMLALTGQKHIGGSWRSGQHSGNWWLEGHANKKRR
jgi:hypothetical protein